MLAPNKQNLLYLKSQKITVGNSLKLLVEKRNGLITMFIEMATEGKKLEQKLQSNWTNFMTIYNYDTAYIDITALRSQLPSTPAISLKVTKKRLSGVYIKALKLAIESPKRPTLKPYITERLETFASIFPEYIKLIEIKLNTQSVASEITKTSRQIRNIENIQEDINIQIKYINSAISEQENQKKATLISLFKS